jgi:electron transport complex protein RnfB
VIAGTVILVGLAVALASLLLVASRYLTTARDDEEIVDCIERLLPRIHCAQCGYPGCRAYAEALAGGRTDVNRCPPGGQSTVQRLADLLGQPVLPLDRELGTASMDQVARIEERICIGCNLCARACPVDAIVGVPQMMHTVIAAECTGCELCLAPCPVDCIEMVSRNA